jgi:hypothetical protein
MVQPLFIGERNPLSRAEFTRRLEALGLRKDRVAHSRTWTWFGITLIDNARTHSFVNAEAPEPTGDADVRADADVQLH